MGSEIKTENRLTQADLLLQVYTLMDIKKIWPKTSHADKIKGLLYVHGKGYLHAALDSDGDVEMFAIMYRIPEYKKEIIDKYPEKEEGNILYIPLFVSISKDTHKAKRLLNEYMNNHPEVKKIMFQERGNDNIVKSFNKEKSHEKRTTETANTNAGVQGRPTVLAGA